MAPQVSPSGWRELDSAGCRALESLGETAARFVESRQTTHNNRIQHSLPAAGDHGDRTCDIETR